MPEFFVGTSGYSYADWVGSFYPQGMQASAYLEFYSKEFRFVELNFSYYRQPDAFMLRKMCKNTPPGFLFAVKAHKSLTHEINDELDRNLEVYKTGIMPLKEADKLGAVLLQFPYGFHYTSANRRHLDYLSTYLQDFPLAVEFRNNEWQQEQVLSGLEARGIGFVNVDTPELPGLPGAAEAVSSPLAYIRFHGRNKKMWWKGDNTTRYDYLYSDAELTEWVDRIKKILEKAKVLFIAFNNHSRGQAVSNARSMRKLLLTR